MRKGPEEFLWSCKALYMYSVVHYVHAADFDDCRVRYGLWIDGSVLKHVVRAAHDNYVAMHFHPSSNFSSEYGHVMSKTFAEYISNRYFAKYISNLKFRLSALFPPTPAMSRLCWVKSMCPLHYCQLFKQRWQTTSTGTVHLAGLTVMLKCFVAAQQKRILANQIMRAKLQVYKIKNERTWLMYRVSDTASSPPWTPQERTCHMGQPPSGGLPFLCCHLYWGHSSSQYNSPVSRTDFWVNLPSVTKTILEDFFFLNAQIEVHRDCNRESNDWQVGLLFFCCLSSPMCAGIKVLTAPLWFLDEDQQTYWQSCLVLPHLSTWGCC